MRSGTGCLFHGRSRFCLQINCVIIVLPIFFYEFRNDVAELSVHGARFTNRDSFFQTFIGFGDQKFARFSDLANQIGLVEVDMNSIFVDSYVEVDNITVFERSAIRNAVADDLVDGGAERFREFEVVER